jgi:hypothetical protein
MNTPAKHSALKVQPEPRWHALLAILAVAALYFALPVDLIMKPVWLFPSVVVLLLVPTVITHQIESDRMNKMLGFALSGVLTYGMIASVVKLIYSLIEGSQIDAPELLRAAGLLWFANVIVFALWYWRLDAGGPHHRETHLGHPHGAFLFPQMTLPEEIKQKARAAKAKDAREDGHEEEAWAPNFIDYLFVAFNTSTAFSPTDVPVLTRWAKVLMMIQSIISLTVIALLAARAVNTFK